MMRLGQSGQSDPHLATTIALAGYHARAVRQSYKTRQQTYIIRSGDRRRKGRWGSRVSGHNDISEKSAVTPSHLETSPRNHQQYCWPRDSGSSTLPIFSDREDISCSAHHVDRFSHQLDLQYPTVAARRNNLETIVPRHRRFVTGWLVRCSALSAPMFPSKRA
jgi:hypothetical protein